jgi:hypothetical protein
VSESVKHQDLGARVVRVHIDHLDNEDGRVWAVDCRAEPDLSRRYLRATNVIIQGVDVITTVRSGKRQPRAWLEAFGRVRVATHKNGAVLVTIRNR